MANAIREKQRLPINPDMLRWARDWRGKTVAEAATKLKQPPERIRAWEKKETDDVPTVKQARELAKFYGRSFLEFFSAKVPDIRPPELVSDFRLYRGTPDPSGDRDLQQIQAWAETQRLNALDLYEELGEKPPSFPDHLRASTRDNVEDVAEQARRALDFSINDQVEIARTDSAQLPNKFRKKLESIGVLPLRHTGVKKTRTRGICLAVFPLPIIVFGAEAPTAQMFTLAHEFGHIIIRQSAVFGSLPKTGGEPNKRAVEEWCNRFAASFLIPDKYLASKFEKPSQPAASISDEALKSLAAHFGVSQHAMLIRLVHLEYVRPEFYWDTKLPEFMEAERDWKQFGRAKYYGTRYRSAVGDLYTGLVLEAWATGRITNHHAAEFMGIKNFKHLNEIRQHFGD